MRFVFLVDGKDYGEMKKILDADPYERDSFVLVGYTLKESKSVGLKGGKYAIQFKTEDPKTAEKLKARLKALPSAVEASKEEFELITKAIDKEEEAANAGFGAIFGQ